MNIYELKTFECIINCFYWNINYRLDHFMHTEIFKVDIYYQVAKESLFNEH